MEKISEEQVFGLMLDKVAEQAAYDEYNAILDELEKEAKISFRGAGTAIKNTAAKVGDAFSAKKLRDTVKTTTGVYSSGAKGKAQRLNIPSTVISTAKSPAGRKSLTAPGIAYGGTLAAGAGAYKGLGTLGKKADLNKEAKISLRGAKGLAGSLAGGYKRGIKGTGLKDAYKSAKEPFARTLKGGKQEMVEPTKLHQVRRFLGSKAVGEATGAYGATGLAAGGTGYGGYRGVQGLRGE